MDTRPRHVRRTPPLPCHNVLLWAQFLVTRLPERSLHPCNAQKLQLQLHRVLVDARSKSTIMCQNLLFKIPLARPPNKRTNSQLLDLAGRDSILLVTKDICYVSYAKTLNILTKSLKIIQSLIFHEKPYSKFSTAMILLISGRRSVPFL